MHVLKRLFRFLLPYGWTLVLSAVLLLARAGLELMPLHRLSTIRNADKIIALEEGQIVEVGDHNELMQRNGLYSQLYRCQLSLAEAW